MKYDGVFSDWEFDKYHATSPSVCPWRVQF
jgi:hypothetical protein